MGIEYSFTGKLWLYGGEAAWYFITLPEKYAPEIRSLAPPDKGFGSVKVAARISRTHWETSVFPDSNSGSYVIPIKKEVRQKLGLEAGDRVKIHLTLKES